ncbi:MAG: hypothetical protein RLZZ50_1628, partial [Verrucomicrobiota bacterium]
MPQTRRHFVRTGALAAASLPLASLLRAQIPPAPAAAAATQPALAGRAGLAWLEGVPAEQPGSAFGVPWPRGTVPAGSTFALTTPEGAGVPVQSWPLATWPDGSVKWSGHAIAANAGQAASLTLVPGQAPAAPDRAVSVRETGDSIEVDTGVITC